MISHFQIFRKHAASKLALAVVALGMAGATVVRADSVTFTTSGVFTDLTGATNYGSSVNSNNNTGDITLSFTGASSVVNAPTSVGFGTFTITNPSGFTGSEGFNDKFILTINQSAPTSGGGSFPPAIISGTVTYSTSSSSTLTITFEPGSVVTIGKFVYTPDNIIETINAPSTGVTTLQGDIDVTASVPSPVAASSGLGLLGVLALGRLRRQSLRA